MSARSRLRPRPRWRRTSRPPGARLPGAGAVAALREEAFARFETDGLPHRRIEEWKYTDLRALMREAQPLAAPPDAAAKARAQRAGATLASIEARRIVFVDGAFAPELSDLAALETGLSIGSIARALASGDADIIARIGQIVADRRHGGCAQYRVHGDGAVIDVRRGWRWRGRCILSSSMPGASQPRYSPARWSRSGKARARCWSKAMKAVPTTRSTARSSSKSAMAPTSITSRSPPRAPARSMFPR